MSLLNWNPHSFLCWFHWRSFVWRMFIIAHFDNSAKFDKNWFLRLQGLLFVAESCHSWLGCVHWKQCIWLLLSSNSIEIGDEAFCYCSSLTKVDLPGSVESIGKRAFCGCSCLKEITIPKSVKSITIPVSLRSEVSLLKCKPSTLIKILYKKNI